MVAKLMCLVINEELSLANKQKVNSFRSPMNKIQTLQVDFSNKLWCFGEYHGRRNVEPNEICGDFGIVQRLKRQGLR